MLKKILFYLAILGSFGAHAQSSISTFSAIFPCSDDDAWVKGGLSGFNKVYQSDSIFTPIDIFANAKIVSHSFSNILVLDSAGRLYGRGVNLYGELGLGDTLYRTEFAMAENVPPLDTVICTRGSFALSLDSGFVYYWGLKNVELFRDTDQVAAETTKTPSRLFKGYFSFSKMALGKDFILLLRSDGALYGYGGNEKRQLGGEQGSYVRKPTFLGLVGIKDVYAGDAHSMALDSTGQVYCFGLNAFGQCGMDPDQNFYVSTPNPIAVNNVVSIAGNKASSYAVTTSGEVYSWGFGSFGGMGNGDSTYINYEPQKVAVDSVISVFAREDYVIAERYDKQFVGWGLDIYGVFGLNRKRVKQFIPIKLPTQCLTTDISELSKEDALLVYPNPSANGVFNLSKASSWIVFNSLGQVIAQGQGTQVDLSSKSDGFYFLRSEGGTEAKVLVKK